MPEFTKIVGKNGTNVAEVTADNELRVIVSDIGAVSVDFVKTGVVTSSYYIFIDLDNEADTGPYKHTTAAGVKLHWLHGHLQKDDPQADWNTSLLVVLSVSGTGANLAPLEISSLHLEDTLEFENRLSQNFSPHVLDLTVVGNDLSKTLVGNVVTDVAEVTNVTTLENAAGDTITPAIGDILVFAEKTSAGSSSIKFHYTTIYEVT